MRPKFTRIFTLLAAAALAGASALPANARPVAPAGGVITGRVTAENTGAGLAGVTVIQYPLDSPFQVDSTATDARGFYTLTVSADAVKLFYMDASDTHVSLWYGGLPYRQPQFSDGAPWRDAAVLTTTGDIGNINMALPLAAAISGTVRDDASSQLLNGASVTLWAGAGRAATTLTNVDGVYELKGLLPGPVKLSVASPTVDDNDLVSGFTRQQPWLDEYHPNAAQIESATPITLTAAITRTVNLDLKLGAVITGNVRSFATGLPVRPPFDTIFAFSCLGARLGVFGAPYKLRGLAPAPTTVQFSVGSQAGSPENYLSQTYNNKPRTEPGDVITPTLGITLTEINGALRSANALTLTLLQGNERITDVIVGFRTMIQSQVTATMTSNYGGFTQLGDGSWVSSTPLPDGVYTVQYPGGDVFAPRYYAAGQDINAATPITLTGGQALGITLTLDSTTPVGFIMGRVTAADSGNPLRNVGVIFYNVAANDQFAGTAETDERGVFTSTKLLPGSYVVYYGAGGSRYPNYASEYSGDVAAFKSAQPVPVSANSTTTADAVIESGGVITGRVVASDTQTPLNNIDVRLFDLRGNLVANSGGGLSLTGADGLFSSFPNRIKPGVYRMAFLDKPLYRYPDCAVLKTYRGAVYPGVATLAQGAPLTLIAGGAISLTQRLSTEPFAMPAQRFVFVPVIRR
jgi:hypothetical protein